IQLWMLGQQPGDDFHEKVGVRQVDAAASFEAGPQALAQRDQAGDVRLARDRDRAMLWRLSWRRSATTLRMPANGIDRPVAAGAGGTAARAVANASTSSVVMRLPGALGGTRATSTPSSRARRRAAGEASTSDAPAANDSAPAADDAAPAPDDAAAG